MKGNKRPDSVLLVINQEGKRKKLPEGWQIANYIGRRQPYTASFRGTVFFFGDTAEEVYQRIITEGTK